MPLGVSTRTFHWGRSNPWDSGCCPEAYQVRDGTEAASRWHLPQIKHGSCVPQHVRAKGTRPRNTAPHNLVTSAAVHFGEFLQEQQAPREYAFVIVKDDVSFLTLQQNLFAFSP